MTALSFSADGKLLSVADDGTAIIWDTSHLKLDKAIPADKIAPDAAWASLADSDAARAFDTMVRLGESPAAAVSLVGERLKPVGAVDGKQIDQLIVQLDDDDFAVREKASQELAKLGGRAEAALRKAVKAATSAEVVRRANELLHKIEEGARSGDQLREARALEVLEGLGTPEARKVLESLAKETPEAGLTQDAKAALERLGKRGGRP